MLRFGLVSSNLASPTRTIGKGAATGLVKQKPFQIASVAPMVEQGTEDPRVGSSNLSRSTISSLKNGKTSWRNW